MSEIKIGGPNEWAERLSSGVVPTAWDFAGDIVQLTQYQPVYTSVKHGWQTWIRVLSAPDPCTEAEWDEIAIGTAKLLVKELIEQGLKPTKLITVELSTRTRGALPGAIDWAAKYVFEPEAMGEENSA